LHVHTVNWFSVRLLMVPYKVTDFFVPHAVKMKMLFYLSFSTVACIDASTVLSMRLWTNRFNIYIQHHVKHVWLPCWMVPIHSMWTTILNSFGHLVQQCTTKLYSTTLNNIELVWPTSNRPRQGIFLSHNKFEPHLPC